MAHPVGWGWEFLVQPHYCSHWSKRLKKVSPVPVRYGPELGLADQWEYDSWLSFIGQPIKTFLIQILIYKNRVLKRVIREEEKGPENNSRQPNFSILDPMHSEQPSGYKNSRSHTFRDIRIIRTASNCHISLSIFFCLPGKQTLLLYCLTKVFQ